MMMSLIKHVVLLNISLGLSIDPHQQILWIFKNESFLRKSSILGKIMPIFHNLLRQKLQFFACVHFLVLEVGNLKI